MTEFGFQLYSLHAVPDSLPDVLATIGDTPFDGVEFAGLDDTTPEDAAVALDDAGLSAAGAHVGLDEIESDPAGVAETAAQLSTSNVVVPWLDSEHFESRGAVQAAGARLSDAADVLADHDVTLHYHNHDQEFVDLDGQPALEALLDAANDVHLELDLGWAGAAGYDPLPLLDAHAGRIDLVHLKDYDATSGEPVKVGTGDLDLDATVELVRDHDFDWLIYEAEERPDSYETLEHAADVVDEIW